jgi:hypothetical protein
MVPKHANCLWCEATSQEAARFDASGLPDSGVHRPQWRSTILADCVLLVARGNRHPRRKQPRLKAGEMLNFRARPESMRIAGPRNA